MSHSVNSLLSDPATYGLAVAVSSAAYGITRTLRYSNAFIKAGVRTITASDRAVIYKPLAIFAPITFAALIEGGILRSDMNVGEKLGLSTLNLGGSGFFGTLIVYRLEKLAHQGTRIPPVEGILVNFAAAGFIGAFGAVALAGGIIALVAYLLDEK